MPLPNLIHPINVVLQRIDRAGTIFDHDARAPVQAAKRFVDVTVPAQIKWLSQKELQAQRGGPTDESRGYALFRYVDLAALSIAVDVGDRIKMLGHITQEVYVIRIEPMGHYQDQNGPSLMRAWFSDRRPAKER